MLFFTKHLVNFYLCAVQKVSEFHNICLDSSPQLREIEADEPTLEVSQVPEPEPSGKKILPGKGVVEEITHTPNFNLQFQVSVDSAYILNLSLLE